MKSPTEQSTKTTFQSSFDNNNSLSSPTPSSPDYATIDFHRSTSSSLVINSPSPPPEKEVKDKNEDEKKISPPKRGIKKKKRRMNGNGVQIPSKNLQLSALDSNNNNFNSNARIYQNLPMYTRSTVTNHSGSVSENYDALEERDRQFATAICKFLIFEVF